MCLFGFTTNVTQAFEYTYATMIGFYLAARLYMTSYIGLIACLIPMIRGIMAYYICINIVGVALWIGSIHTDWPNQLAIIWIALFIDVTGPLFFVFMIMLSNRFSILQDWMCRVFEFYPGKLLA